MVRFLGIAICVSFYTVQRSPAACAEESFKSLKFQVGGSRSVFLTYAPADTQVSGNICTLNDGSFSNAVAAPRPTLKKPEFAYAGAILRRPIPKDFPGPTPLRSTSRN